MDYDERMNIVMEEMVAFLSRFSPPKGMADRAQKETIKSCCDAVVRKMPDDAEKVFRHNLEITFRNVLDYHETYAWPRQADFVKHLSFDKFDSTKAPETFQTDDAALNVRRMNNDKPVPEGFIWRRSMDGVNQAIVDQYRKTSVKRYVKVYSRDAARVMSGKYGQIVLAYFNTDRAAQRAGA